MGTKINHNVKKLFDIVIRKLRFMHMKDHYYHLKFTEIAHSALGGIFVLAVLHPVPVNTRSYLEHLKEW